MLTTRSGMSGFIKSLGPGLLWAGAAIGVSHLVQSTRAGANFGFALIWVILFANLIKYPFFEFGPRYAAATGESLLGGYKRLGNWAVIVFILLTIGLMFTIMAAVTLVTAGLASQLTGLALTPVGWSAVLLTFCVIVLAIGKYPVLDLLIKIIIVVLALSTVVAVVAAFIHGSAGSPVEPPPKWWHSANFGFLAALIGWMPSAFDIAVWNSIWTLERKKQTRHTPRLKESLFDFNLGYIGTALLAVGFMSLGALVMFGTGTTFSASPGEFARQLIQLYSSTLGDWSYPLILIAAFTTMFSTTLTVTDGFPRVLKKSFELLSPTLNRFNNWLYWFWMLVVIGGSLIVIAFLGSSLKGMVDLATTLSFITAPVLGIINYKVVTAGNMPPEAVPRGWLKALSWFGMVALTVMSLLFLVWRFLLN